MVGSEYYVNILSFVDKDLLEPGCTVLLNHKMHAVVGVLSDDADPMVSVMKLDKAPQESYADVGMCVSLLFDCLVGCSFVFVLHTNKRNLQLKCLFVVYLFVLIVFCFFVCLFIYSLFIYLSVRLFVYICLRTQVD